MKKQIIGLGTAAIGRPHYINIRQEEVEIFDLERFKTNGISVLEMAYQQGVRYFDTAPNYGVAEELVLNWAKAKADKTIEIATKWGYSYTANFDINAETHELKEHSLANLNRQWEFSKNLLPNLSTYQIHSATFETKVLENEAILNRLTELKAEHNLKIGITVSGDNQVEILKKALEVEINGLELFEVFQVTYNVFDQSLATIETAFKSENKRLIIKEAMANGRVFPNVNFPNYEKIYSILNQLANKYKVGVDAIAIRFIEDTIQPFKVLSGAAISEHLIGNLKANDLN
ncbi:MAG: aldo/keto reductase [Saprospiraceae bacterium]|nr:aldo/keto reductase [Saprospiraceae bacterium]